MTKKKWIVVAIAAILLVVSGMSRLGLHDDGAGEGFLDQYNPAHYLFASSEAYIEVLEPGDSDSGILVLPVHGVIGVDGEGYNHELLLTAIESAKTDPSVQAILLDIDSPGGSVYHTHELYTALMEVKEERDLPVYASMGSVAASGGYYLAMAADQVFASPESLTGSIGVIMSQLDLSELMDEFGVKEKVIKSGEMKDIMSPSREMTQAEEDLLQSYVDESFDAFVAVVDQGRDNLNEEEIRDLADGRIFSGRQAQREGLIDELGFFKDALAQLRQDQGLEEAEVYSFVQDDPFDLFGNFPFFKNDDLDLVSQLEELDQAQGLSLDYLWKGGLSNGQ